MNKKTQVALLLTTLTMHVSAMELDDTKKVTTLHERFKGCEAKYQFVSFKGTGNKIEKINLKKGAIQKVLNRLDDDETLNLKIILKSTPKNRVMVTGNGAFSNMNLEGLNVELLIPEFVDRIKKRHKRLPRIRSYYVTLPKNCQNLCLGSTALTKVDFSGARRGKKCYTNKFSKHLAHPNSTRNMFSGCANLQSINLGKFFNTQKVTNMDRMFFNCASLEEVKNLDHLDTSKVRTMSEMFANCKSLEHVDISMLDTSNVQSMNKMFLGCKSLETVNLSNIDTKSLQTTWQMFKDCEKLSHIDTGTDEFNTGQLRNICNMFEDCKSLQELDLSKFYTNHVDYMTNFISGCSKLQSVIYHPFAEQTMLRAENRCKDIDLLKKKRALDKQRKDEAEWEDDWSEAEDRKVIDNDSDSI